MSVQYSWDFEISERTIKTVCVLAALCRSFRYLWSRKSTEEAIPRDRFARVGKRLSDSKHFESTQVRLAKGGELLNHVAQHRERRRGPNGQHRQVDPLPTSGPTAQAPISLGQYLAARNTVVGLTTGFLVREGGEKRTAPMGNNGKRRRDREKRDDPAVKVSLSSCMQD